MKKKIVIIGAGGHTRVILDILKNQTNFEVVGLTDPKKKGSIYGKPIIGGDGELERLFENKKANYAFIGVGGTGYNFLRAALFDKAIEIGFDFPNIYHHSCIISSKANIAEKGNLINANCVINCGVVAGMNNIFNTGAIIEHDCDIGDHCHIAPGANISGGVKLENNVHVGVGATIIERVEVGKNSIIGAGSIVINDVPRNSLVVGNPGKVIKKVEKYV